MIPIDPTDMHWTNDAACATVDPELFFPGPGGGARYETALAQQVCASCPVSRQCLDFAVQIRPEYGIWAGIPARKLPRRSALARRQVVVDGIRS